MSDAAQAAPLTSTAARAAARVLREQILKVEDGAFLGTEDELMRRVSLSRPTFRQAARILESEQLLTVRRGIGGGYFGRRPEVGSVVHTGALYLRLRNVTMSEFIDTSTHMMLDIARNAAQSTDAALRKQLSAYLENSIDDKDWHETITRFLSSEAELLKILCAMARKPSLEMFLLITYEIGNMEAESRLFAGRADRVRAMGQFNRRLAKAILSHDSRAAERVAGQRGAAIAKWLQEDRQDRGADSVPQKMRSTK